jgi:hypothetical protein
MKKINNKFYYSYYIKRYFRNSSFLLVVDNNSNKYNYKWIDFTYTGDLSDDIEEPN